MRAYRLRGLEGPEGLEGLEGVEKGLESLENGEFKEKTKVAELSGRRPSGQDARESLPDTQTKTDNQTSRTRPEYIHTR